MTTLRILPDLTQQGFRDEDYPVTKYTGPVAIGGMPEGTENGHPTVMIGLDNEEDGGIIVVETTLALFLSAADALKAKYGDPR
jgi:hypothetical protein